MGSSKIMYGAQSALAGSRSIRGPWLRAVRLAAPLAILLVVALLSIGADAPSKNRTGNRLFARGQYQEAEKAYLEAHADAPERPELSYNLGNALIKQKKYEEALASLEQAIKKGNPGLQGSGWYNSGNALFDMGKFQESAQAYVQALRLNPGDRDAKHNLELALRKTEQQKKESQQGGNSGQDQPDSAKAGQGEGQKQNQPNPKSPQGQPPPQQQGQEPANPQPSTSGRSEERFSRERALQILDAIQNQELSEQRKLLERQAQKKVSGRIW